MYAIAKRLPAIAALTIAAILAVLAAGLAVRLIETRSLNDVSHVLRLNGYDWAAVSVDGLQVRLTGTAPSEAFRFRAISAAGTVIDSARVIDEMQVAEAVLEAPHFAIEILRNDTAVSLIGLIPRAMDRDAFVTAVVALAAGGEVTDLLDSADHPVPEGWDAAIAYGLDALRTLPRSKISIAAGRVEVSGISDSAAEQRRLEADLARRTPEGLRVALEITAPRPAITPFTLRFLINAAGRVRFDACSADTEEAREKILKAAVAAGLAGKSDCVIGLGAPSPRWGDAAALAIAAVRDLGGGAVTISDADVSLVALDTTPKPLFDTVVGTLDNALPDAFSLHAVLPEPVKVDGTGEGDGPPEFVAVLAQDGALAMRGRVRDEREQAVIDGYAKALFGASNVQNATRLDDSLPEGWPVRVMAALESLDPLQAGSIVVQPDFVEVRGVTGDPEASAGISRLLSSKLGEAANFEIDVTYDKKLDPVLGLPTAAECVAEINAELAERKISFAPGAAEIDPGAGETLDRIAGLMKNCADYAMEIGAHSDSQGREEMNQELSQSRAEAVLNALLARRALTVNLTARGYGESAPVADNGSEAGREANRRIEFRLVSADEGTAAGDPGAAEGTDAAAGTEAGAAETAGGDGSSTDEPD